MSLEEKNFTKSPSDNKYRTEGKYVILMETNDEELEQWYYFLKVDGNQENLNHLQKQLEKVDWELMEDLSTFELDMDYFVSAQTAKEMSKVIIVNLMED